MTTAESKWATDERRLGPAYDDIAAGRLKPASSLVERHLKKHPTSQPALVLRLVLLERLGSNEKPILEAWEAAKKAGDLTSRSAWFIGTTFRNMGRRDLTLEIYQSQWANQPDSVELGEQVFLHAAGAWDQDVMVESSRKMFNKLKAPVWARVAAWSEWVKNAPHPSSQDSFTSSNSNALRVSSTLLSLARKQCESADILWLHLQIFISAGNLSDALVLAQSAGAEGSLARLWYRMQGVKEILSRMKEKGEDTTAGWTAEWEWVKGRLSDPDCHRNYAFYQHLLLATQQLLSVESVISETLEALEAVHAEIGEKERAPCLALMELDEILVKNSHARAMSIDQWSEMAGSYWNRWGARRSVVQELEGLASGNPARRAALEAFLEKTTSEHTTLDEYHRVVNKEMILLRGKPESWESDESYLRSLSKLYSAGLQYGRNLPKTDVQPADDIGLALAHVLFEQWSRSPADETLLLRAILLLRYILDRSPACKSALLLLGRALRLVGASSMPECTVGMAAKEWTEIQLDNLSHFSHDRAGVEAFVNGTDDGWAKYEAAAAKMYRRTAADMPDYVKSALQHESYSKIPGMRTLASTLQHSSSRYLVAVERARLEVVSGKSITPDTAATLQEALSTDDLVDTRDWSLIPDLGPNRVSLRKALSLGEEAKSVWIKAWTMVLLRVEGLGSGLQTPEVDTAEVSPAERAMLSTITDLVAKADAVPDTSGQSSDVLASDDQIQKLIDSIKSATSTPAPFWDRLYHFFLLVELEKLLARIGSRLEPASKTAGKKGSKASPAVVNLVKEIQGFQDRLRKGVEELLPILADMRAVAEKVKWEDIRSLDDFPDGDYLVEYGKSVTEARLKGIDSIKRHLTS